MASENNDIGDIVRKCKILLLDIEGTTTSISFVKDTLFPYAETNVKEYLETQWESDDVKEAVAALRKLSVEDEEQKVEGFVAIPGEDAAKEEQIEGLVKSVKWQMLADRKAGALKLLQGLIWKQGYDKGDIKGHVYDDVAPALSQWKSTEGQKVYIYSSGSVQAQKLLFSNSVAGDLLPHIEGHFDTAVGPKQDTSSYAAIVEKIGCKADEILFLTDIVKEADAARASGVYAALVNREGNAPLPADATASYPVLQSFDQLIVSNKRKPEPQEEEVPAKVPKTDIEADVKTVIETEVPEAASEAIPEEVTSTEAVPVSENVTAENIVSEPEKMEVEEEIPTSEEPSSTEQPEEVTKESETTVQIDTITDEVIASKEATNEAASNVESVIVEESVEKTDTIETEKMETESTVNVEPVETVVEPVETVVEPVETVVEPKEQMQEDVKENGTVAEETSPAVVIEEVTNDQEIVNEGVELVEVVPVVEEPPAVEMEDLNNVADVLDKECDEILLKVQDVTNLDSIPVKPLLNSIAEEDIGAENGENTNDIVDSILESEMELGEKACEDIDVNVVQEMTDTKTDSSEVISDAKMEENIKAEETTMEVPVEENAVKTAVADKLEASSASEAICPETITEVVKEVTNGSATEITNGEKEECSVDVVAETTSVKEVEMNVIKEVTSEVTDVPEETLVTSEKNTESEVAIENQTETKESDMEVADSAKPVEDQKESEQNTVVENESKAQPPTEEQLDNKMEAEDIAETEQKETDLKDSTTQIDNEKKSVEVAQNKMESEDSLPQESEAIESNVESMSVTPENKVDESEKETPAPAVPEVETVKENETKDVAMETEATEKVNGNMNGEPEVNQNGDTSKEEELCARLSVENGENGKEMNGANGNGDASEIEKEQDEKKDAEIPDIKVKSVASDEPRTDPIEQPVEA